MINAIIIDDDERCIRALQYLLQGVTRKVKVLAECTDADTGIRAIAALKPDIVFLDVEMPGKTGFELVDELDEVNFDIVFTTAYEHYALRAIKASAFDFLLKPIDADELTHTLQRIERKLNKQQALQQVKTLLENYGQSKNAVKTIAVPTSTGLEFIRVNQIVRMEADSSYTTFFFAGGTKLVVAKTLKEMEELLPENTFFRVHNSHIISLEFVKRYNKNDGGSIIMENNTEVPVSRQRKDALLEFLKSK